MKKIIFLCMLIAFSSSTFSQEPEGYKKGIHKLKYADGRIYDGEWDEFQHNGMGTMTWADGKKYTGQWVNGKMNGLGEKVPVA